MQAWEGSSSPVHAGARPRRQPTRALTSCAALRCALADRETAQARGDLLPEQGVLVSRVRTCRAAAAQALEEAKSSSLLFWGSRYHLFVSWSADRAHPWDALPAAGHYAMLEIGNHRGTDGQVQARDRRTSAPGPSYERRRVASAQAVTASLAACASSACGLQDPEKEAGAEGQCRARLGRRLSGRLGRR